MSELELARGQASIAFSRRQEVDTDDRRLTGINRSHQRRCHRLAESKLTESGRTAIRSLRRRVRRPGSTVAGPGGVPRLPSAGRPQGPLVEQRRSVPATSGPRPEDDRRRLARFLPVPGQHARSARPGSRRSWCHASLNARRRPPVGPFRVRLAGAGGLAGTTTSPSNRAQKECLAAGRSTAALAGLPERHRAVIHLRIWEQLSFAQVGTRLGISEDAARMLLRAGPREAPRIDEARP